MHTLTVHLPDAAFACATWEASRRQLEVPVLCSGLLADHFLRELAARKAPDSGAAPATNRSAVVDRSKLKSLDVAQEFRGFPHRSIEFAQAFVNETLKIPGTAAHRKGAGIAFEPNFVYIEALLMRGSRSGIRVSFFGRPEQFQNPPAALKMGRPPSYSRAVIEDKADLDAIFEVIRQSYELRFGRRP